MANAKFLDFLDMIDGGGAGKMGDKFEGGGIFSALANMIASPYGSEDEARKRARMQAHGLLGANPAATPSYGGGDIKVDPVLRPKLRPSDEERLKGMPVQAMSAEERLMGMPVQANPMYAQSAAEAGMGLDPFGGAGPTPPASDFMNTLRSAGNLSGPAGMPTPPKEPSLIAAEQLASELGNAWYMMPQQEQIMRINQRVQQMQGM